MLLWTCRSRGLRGPCRPVQGAGRCMGTACPLTVTVSTSPPAVVERALARQRHCHQNTENPGLDNSEEQRLQRGISKAAVSAGILPPGSCGSGGQVFSPGEYTTGRSQAGPQGRAAVLPSGAPRPQGVPGRTARWQQCSGQAGDGGCGQHPPFSGLSLLLQDLFSPQRATSAGRLPVPPSAPPCGHQPLDALRLPLQRLT